MLKFERNKTNRMLFLYEKLLNKEVIKKQVESDRFQVTLKTIQRDVADLKYYIERFHYQLELIYDRRLGGYTLSINESMQLHKGEMMALFKIVLDSSSLTSNESRKLLEKILFSIPIQDQQTTQFFSRYLHECDTEKDATSILNTLKLLTEAIEKKKWIKLSSSEKGKIVFAPVDILLHQNSFYLTGFLKEKITKERLPNVFLIQKEMKIDVLSEKFQVPSHFRVNGEMLKKMI